MRVVPVVAVHADGRWVAVSWSVAEAMLGRLQRHVLLLGHRVWRKVVKVLLLVLLILLLLERVLLLLLLLVMLMLVVVRRWHLYVVHASGQILHLARHARRQVRRMPGAVFVGLVQRLHSVLTALRAVVVGRRVERSTVGVRGLLSTSGGRVAMHLGVEKREGVHVARLCPSRLKSRARRRGRERREEGRLHGRSYAGSLGVVEGREREKVRWRCHGREQDRSLKRAESRVVFELGSFSTAPR